MLIIWNFECVESAFANIASVRRELSEVSEKFTILCIMAQLSCLFSMDCSLMNGIDAFSSTSN